MLGARRALEIGTFTGYSAICIARGLDEGGSLLCCEISERWAEVARRNLADAGLAERVELRVAPAIETLRSISPEPAFDFAFIDADKAGYHDYYEETLTRLRVGGVIVLDNVLMAGRVIDQSSDDEAVIAMRALNSAIASDVRVDCAMVGVADGLTILRKR